MKRISLPGWPGRRWRRLRCEQLEGRVLLSGGVLPPSLETQATTSQSNSLSLHQRIREAFESAWQQYHPTGQSDGEPPTLGGDVVDLDLNGDGLLDRVKLSRSGGGAPDGLDIFAQKPDGTYTPLPHVGLGFTAEALLACSLNADEAADLFVPGKTAGQGAVLLGRGDGTFSVHQRFGTRLAMAVADLDGYGADDFVYASEDGDWISLDLDGQRTVLADGATGLIGPVDVQLADINNDGLQDLIVPSAAAGVVFMFPGLGGGVFGPELNGGEGLPAATTPSAVTFTRLGDVLMKDPQTGKAIDPYLDMVVACAATNQVILFFGNGDGTFTRGPSYQVGAGPSDVVLGDATGEGEQDLIVTSRGSDSVWVLPGRGKGLFDKENRRVLPTGPSPIASFVGDFDGDRRVDLVTVNSGNPSVTFYSNVARLDTAPRTVSTGGSAPVAALMRDVNGDEISDLIVATHDDGVLTLLTGGASGLEMTQTLESSLMPAGLAGSNSITDPYSFYVLDETTGQAHLVSLGPASEPPDDLPLPTEPVPMPETPPAAPPPQQTDTVEVDLRPLLGAAVDVAPTLLARAGERPGETEDPAGQALTLFLPVLGAGRNGSQQHAASGAVEEVPPPADPPAEPAAEEAEDLKLKRYLLGTDEAATPLIEVSGASEEEGANKPALDLPAPSGPVPGPAPAPAPAQNPEIPTGAEEPEAGDGLIADGPGRRMADLFLALAACAGWLLFAEGERSPFLAKRQRRW